MTKRSVFLEEEEDLLEEEDLEELEDDEEGEDGEDDEEEFGEEYDSEERVQMMAQAADSLKGVDIIALDLRELTIISDFFLICTGNSSIHIRSIADRVDERMSELGLDKFHSEGYKEATWVLLDYGDIVVHVMSAEQREFYNIEKFWAKAPLFELELLPA